MIDNSQKWSAGSERNLRSYLNDWKTTALGRPDSMLPAWGIDIETSPSHFSVLKTRNPRVEIDLVYFDWSCVVGEGMIRLRDLIRTMHYDDQKPSEHSLFSVPAEGLEKEHLFQTFEPITLHEGRPDWARFFCRWRGEPPPVVPETIVHTWLEGRWTARVKTTTFPVTISAWFENPDDVVLLRLAGMPLSQKDFAISSLNRAVGRSTE